MVTWNIYRIVDHNECPPITTFYDSSKHQKDVLQELRDSGKDLSLIDIDVVSVQRSKTQMVNLLNCVIGSPQYGGRDHDEPIQLKKAHRHLRLVK